MLCSTEYSNSIEELKVKIEEFQPNLLYTNLNSKCFIPKEGPSTKELVLDWSNRYWPLVWHGNPNDQTLNDYTFDMDYIQKILKRISEIANEQSNTKNLPIVSAFVDPKNEKHVFYSIDERNCERKTPLDHSIMCGVKSVAEHQKLYNNDEKKQLTTYLCLNFDVYTTHEPCSMCAMALVHSRIKRCIFINPMDKTGALKPQSGNGYCMHDNRLLNSKYEVFQWIGQDYNCPLIDKQVCA